MSQHCFPIEIKFDGQGILPARAAGESTNQGSLGGTMSDLNARISAMHKRDVQVAWAFVLGLWFSIIFVAVATWDLAPSSTARVVLLIGGAVILILNTAAITAMLKHYREDRDFMYGLDIKFLDAARDQKGL
jgi:hypothetical protein